MRQDTRSWTQLPDDPGSEIAWLGWLFLGASWRIGVRALSGSPVVFVFALLNGVNVHQIFEYPQRERLGVHEG